MLLGTYYAQNYASIIGGSLIAGILTDKGPESQCSTMIPAALRHVLPVDIRPII